MNFKQIITDALLGEEIAIHENRFVAPQVVQFPEADTKYYRKVIAVLFGSVNGEVTISIIVDGVDDGYGDNKIFTIEAKDVEDIEFKPNPNKQLYDFYYSEEQAQHFAKSHRAGVRYMLSNGRTKLVSGECNTINGIKYTEMIQHGKELTSKWGDSRKVYTGTKKGLIVN